MSPGQLSAAFFLQMLVMLSACRAVGWMAKRVGQPQVVGEMIAGVLLGPSFFGLLFPQVQQQLFPEDSIGVLYVASQFGVGLYMFIVGLEFRTELQQPHPQRNGGVGIGDAGPVRVRCCLGSVVRGHPGVVFSPGTHI